MITNWAHSSVLGQDMGILIDVLCLTVYYISTIVLWSYQAFIKENLSSANKVLRKNLKVVF